MISDVFFALDVDELVVRNTGIKFLDAFSEFLTFVALRQLSHSCRTGYLNLETLITSSPT